MKFLLLLSLCALLAGCAKNSTVTSTSLPTVASVDIERYRGLWYEVARLPNRFQQADSKATAEYAPAPKSSISVRNIEFRPDGTTKAAEGTAKAVEGSNGARLKVRFKGLAALAPVSSEGNYWVIDLQPDYSFAMVGTPSRKFLWLLSRDRKPGKKVFEAAVAKAKSLGFPTENLLRHQW